MGVASGHHLIEVPERNLKLDMPQELAYCDERQYREMSELLYRYSLGAIDIEQLKYAAVYRLLNLKKSKKPSKGHQSNISLISELIGSFFDKKEIDGKEQLHVRQGYVHNPIPVVRCGFKKLYGPEDYFTDITFGQYVDGLNHLATYVSSPNLDSLTRLFATFYQSKRHKLHKIYDKKNLESRITLSRKAYLGDIYGFFLLFASFQNYLTTAAVTWEGQELDLSILYSTTKSNFKSKIPGLGMKSMTYILAETSVFGDLKEVEQTNFWEAILRMYDIKKRDLDEQVRSKSKEQ